MNVNTDPSADKELANNIINTYDISSIIKSSTFNNYVMNQNHGGSDCVMQIYKEKWMADLRSVKFDGGQTFINYVQHLATDTDAKYMDDAYYEYVYEGKYSSVSYSSRLKKYGKRALTDMNSMKSAYNSNKATNMLYILNNYIRLLAKTNRNYLIMSKTLTYSHNNTAYLNKYVF